MFKKIMNYCKDSYNELIYKTTWPSWRELTNSAVVVLFASLLIAIVVWIMDLSFQGLMDFIYTKLF